MREFLDEYIVSLSGKRQVRIQEILAAARVAKGDLDALALRLQDIRKEDPIVIAAEGFNSRIDAGKFDGAHRDATRRLLELFEASNLVSLLLDTHGNLLASEIKAVEDELLAMEKAVDNYAFSLSDAAAYDYAFTETFNDNTMEETDEMLILTDRSGVPFTHEERARVNGSSGILTLNPSLKTSYPLVGQIVDSNCLALATSDTGLGHSLNSSVTNGWRVAISSPKPITSKLGGVDTRGAQVELEIYLHAAAPCDTIVLTPFSDIPIQVLRVQVISGTDDTNAFTVLSTPTLLDRPLTLSFPMQAVAKFKVLVNQSVYTRGQLPAVKEQIVYKDFYSSIKEEKRQVELYMGKDYRRNRKALKRVFVRNHRRDSDYKIFKAETPQIDFEAKHGPLTIDKIIDRPKQYNTEHNNWRYESKVSVFMRKMIEDGLFATNTDIKNNRQVLNVGSAYSRPNTGNLPSTFDGLEPSLNANILSYPVIEEHRHLDYQYNLGLRNIEIGTGVQIYRGVFVTKHIPAPSGTGEIKLKVDDTNFKIMDTSRDSDIITTIEYSVSNKSAPRVESDWIPVLPIDTTTIEGERVFINEAGVGFFRFHASMQGTFSLYKDGYLVDLNTITTIMNDEGTAIIGVQIPLTAFTSTDIFTVDYVPYGDQSTINFEDKGFSQFLLASAFDDTGAGETFSSTYNNQIITLTYDPFVSYDDINEDGSYSSTYGFLGDYQPITIVLSDGTVAYNHTNYLGGTQNNLADVDDETVAYLHSGKNIIFNQAITEPFTVYYQYIPSNLRLRIVMRVNDINYVSPFVNSMQIKTKTLKADARKAL